MSWIKTEWDMSHNVDETRQWPLRTANVVLPYLFLRNLTAIPQTPEAWDAFFTRVLCVASDGRFAHATIYRIQQCYDRLVWLITILDEGLPIVKEYERLPCIELDLSVEAYERLRQEMVICR